MNPQNKKTPPPSQTSLAANGDGRGATRSQHDTLENRLSRYASARKRAVQNLVYLQHREPSDAKEASRQAKAVTGLHGCGTWLKFRDYYTVGDVRLHQAAFCRQHLLCPLCAIRRSSKAMGAYLERFEQIATTRPNLTPWLITFTVKNGDDLAERMLHLRRSFRTLQDRRRLYRSRPDRNPYTEFSCVEGAVFSYEVTNTGKGWHPHMHLVALVDQAHEVDQQSLRNEWERITGDSFMVDVRPFHEGQDPAEGFAEVFKYALKFQELKPDETWHAAETLRGTRLLDSFGCFRGVKVPESLADEPLDGLPFFELLYRYKHKAGYDLVRYTEGPGESEHHRVRDVRTTREGATIPPVTETQKSFEPIQIPYSPEPAAPRYLPLDLRHALSLSRADPSAGSGRVRQSEPLTAHQKTHSRQLPGDATASPGDA